VRSHLEAALSRGTKTQRERAATELSGKTPFPHELAYLYGWARELHRARPRHRGMPAPITYTDMDAWARLTGRTPEPDEVDALLWVTSVMAFPPDA
jgi:hypothetical protein